MTAAKIIDGAMRDSFVWTPGDGYAYRWSGDYKVIRVFKITYDSEGVRREVYTGDTVPLPATHTATALCAAVTAWKTGRQAA